LITRTTKDVEATTAVKRILRLDVKDLAVFIEEVFQNYLKPITPGLYLPGHLEPTLYADKSYWFEKIIPLDMTPYMHLPENNRPVCFRYEYAPMVSLHQAIIEPWDIVDKVEDGKIIAHHRDLRHASLTPTLPVNGMLIARALITNEIEGTAAYLPEMNRVLFEDIIAQFLQESYSSVRGMKDNEYAQQMVNSVFEYSRECMQHIRQFSGGNPWMMHDIVVDNSSVIQIHQMGDFRIHDWERRMASGQWT
jgi:hypothetical protein